MCENSKKLTKAFNKIHLEIYHSNIKNNLIFSIKKALETTYKNILTIVSIKEIKLIENAYNPNKNQYNSNILIDYLLNCKCSDIALWIIDKDLYCTGMNFIFGSALHKKAAVLSIFRLDSQKLIEKEAIHEIGHVLGLKHCTNSCVMQFSNTLFEAKFKPSTLCNDCKNLIMQLHS